MSTFDDPNEPFLPEQVRRALVIRRTRSGIKQVRRDHKDSEWDTFEDWSRPMENPADKGVI